MQRAICSSLPVGLEMSTNELAVATRRDSSTAPASFARNSVAIAAAISADVGEDLVREQLHLALAVLAPELEHDVRAAGLAVLLDRGHALRRRAGDRLALRQDLVTDGRRCREPAAALHRVGDRADLLLAQAGEFEQDVGRALDVLD